MAGLDVIVAMVGGFLLPAYLIYRFAKRILSSAPAKLRASSEIENRTIKITSIIGLILAAVPGVLSSLMLGGYLGGGLGEMVSIRLGLGSIGVPFGIFLGMTLYISFIGCIGMLIGTILGKIVGIILSKWIFTQKDLMND